MNNYYAPNQGVAGLAYGQLQHSNKNSVSITITKPLKSGGSFVLSATGMSSEDIETLFSSIKRLSIFAEEPAGSFPSNQSDVGKPSGQVGEN